MKALCGLSAIARMVALALGTSAALALLLGFAFGAGLVLGRTL